MIIREEVTINGKKFVKNHSDKNVLIRNVKGQLFAQATDPIEFAEVRVYTETNKPIPERKKPTPPKNQE